MFSMNSSVVLVHGFRNVLLHPVHTTSEEFKNGTFTLKTNQMFSIHTTPKKYENATITGHCVGGKLGQGNPHMIIVVSTVSKSSVFKLFSVHTKTQSRGVFKFLRFAERFWKAPFSWRISRDLRPNRWNKAAFSDFFGFVWTGHY